MRIANREIKHSIAGIRDGEEGSTGAEIRIDTDETWTRVVDLMPPDAAWMGTCEVGLPYVGICSMQPGHAWRSGFSRVCPRVRAEVDASYTASV